MDVDRQGNIRHLTQTTVFIPGPGQSAAAGESIFTTDFTLSDFGIRFSVTPPAGSQVAENGNGMAVQF